VGPVVGLLGDATVLVAHQLDIGRRQRVAEFAFYSGNLFVCHWDPDVLLLGVLRRFPELFQIEIAEDAGHASSLLICHVRLAGRICGRMELEENDQDTGIPGGIPHAFWRGTTHLRWHPS
jgi:hypothetical protein